MHIYISGNPGVYLHLCSPIDLSYDWCVWGGGLVILERPVHLLHVGEHHLGVEAARADHLVHVLAGDEVGDARQPPGGSSRNKGNMQGTCSGQGRSWSCHAHHRCLISILTLQSGMPTRNSVFYSLPTAWKSQKPEGKEMLTVWIWCHLTKVQFTLYLPGERSDVWERRMPVHWTKSLWNFEFWHSEKVFIFKNYSSIWFSCIA